MGGDISHCGFDLPFSNDYWCWATFPVPVGHLYVFFRKVCRYSTHFLIVLFAFLLLNCKLVISLLSEYLKISSAINSSLFFKCVEFIEETIWSWVFFVGRFWLLSNLYSLLVCSDILTSWVSLDMLNVSRNFPISSRLFSIDA